MLTQVAEEKKTYWIRVADSFIKILRSHKTKTKRLIDKRTTGEYLGI